MSKINTNETKPKQVPLQWTSGLKVKMPIFDKPTEKSLKQFLAFLNLFQNAKSLSVYSVNSFLRYSQFESYVTGVGMPIFDHAQPKKIQQALIFMNFVQYAKNQAISSICSGDMADIKMVQYDWLKTFWYLSQELDFPKYRTCAETQHIVLTFIIK